MKKAYVITYYYNNGETWEDEMHYEVPHKVYLSLDEALKTDEFIENEFMEIEGIGYKYESIKHGFDEDDDYYEENLHPDEYYEYRIYECEVQEK